MTLFRKKSQPMATYTNVTAGLKEVYKSYLLPLEKEYKFHDIHSPMMEDPDFDGKPLVMLIGQYSTGKTTFIRYILEQDYPGMRIGPEPTTDNFNIIDFAEQSGKIPGNVLAVDSSKPYKHLQQFGGTFLTRFESSQTNAEILKNLTVLDTPGILAGEKQLVNRGYEFTGVLKWFAERADRIILLFDAHKLDISDEFKSAIQAIRKNEDKIRILLNKADMLNHQQLMRVYGALMWSLARILKNPEVSRIYVGSFWNQPLQYVGNKDLFEIEQDELFNDLQELPRFATVRRLNDLIKRATWAKVNALIIAYLKSQMPVLGKEGKKKDLIKKLDEVYRKIQDEHNIPAADFPDIENMRKKLEKYDFTKFPVLNKEMISQVDRMLGEDIPRIMSLMPREQLDMKLAGEGYITGGIFQRNGIPVGVGFNEGMGEKGWVVNRKKPEYDVIFNSLEESDGKITGRIARGVMLKSKLPSQELGKIWSLADVDQDGFLDSEEFALAMHLIKVKTDGHQTPLELPEHLIPPGHKKVGPINGHQNGVRNGGIQRIQQNGIQNEEPTLQQTVPQNGDQNGHQNGHAEDENNVEETVQQESEQQEIENGEQKENTNENENANEENGQENHETSI